MAFNKTPTAWLSGYTENGTNISIPLATLAELTADEADASTGDIRKILWALITHLQGVYAGLDAEDQPDRMRIVKAQSLASDGQIRESYTMSFTLDYSSLEVAAE